MDNRIVSSELLQNGKLAELTQVVKSGRCIAFVGAGLSRPQCPDLRELIGMLCKECGIDLEPLPDEERMDPRSLANRAKQANRCRFDKVLLREFAHPEPGPRQFDLAKTPFRAFVTLNYDPLLKKSLEHAADKKVDVYPYPHLPAWALGDPNLCASDLTKHSLYHVHGYIDETTVVPDVVLTSEEYKQAYKNTLLPSFLNDMLAYFPTCFLGCRLFDDVMLRGVLRLCKLIQGGLAKTSPYHPPRWYMLIDRDEFGCLDINLDEYGITPVPYDKANEEYEGLDEILKEWAGVQPARIAVPFEDTTDLYKTDQEPSR